MENITYLSDLAQVCLVDLFSTSYEKTDDYMKSVFEIANCLIDESNEYDGILNKYDGVNKNLLKQMILSNFSEITYYRRKNGIQLDSGRLNILEAVETADLNDDGVMVLLHCDMPQFATMINDVLLYFWHPSPIYSYNIVKAMNEDGFAKKLYPIYPLAMSEHMLTLDYSYSEKETLLYTLKEAIVNATERITFANGGDPIPNSGYLQDIANKLKKYNGRNPELPNLHEQILEEFNAKMGITEGIDYNKVLILEILVATVQAKQNQWIPESKIEKQVIEYLNKTNLTLENLSNFYDNNEKTIISSLIDDWNMVSDENMLADVEFFKKVKEQGTKNLKKDLKKEDKK